MTEPLTPEEEAGLRGRHYAFENDERSIVCHEDARGWPCGTARLLATLDAARAATPAAPGDAIERAFAWGGRYLDSLRRDDAGSEAINVAIDYLSAIGGLRAAATPAARWFDNMEHGPAPVAAEDPVTCADCLETVTEVDAETGDCRECFDRLVTPAVPEALDWMLVARAFFEVTRKRLTAAGYVVQTWAEQDMDRQRRDSDDIAAEYARLATLSETSA